MKHFNLNGASLEEWYPGCISVKQRGGAFYPKSKVVFMATCDCCFVPPGWDKPFLEPPQCNNPSRLRACGNTEQEALKAVLVVRDQHTEKHHY